MVNQQIFLFTVYHRPFYPLIKLFQEAYVVFEQQADVVEFVHESNHAVDAKAKSEAGKLIKIYPGGAKYVRMDHARSTQLNPAGILADTTP